MVCASVKQPPAIARMPSGMLLLVTNDDRMLRKSMTLHLSEDDGATWRYKHCIDVRNNISYPDADVFGDTIYLTYDRERTGAKEILFTRFTEQDIIDGTVTEPWVILLTQLPAVALFACIEFFPVLYLSRSVDRRCSAPRRACCRWSPLAWRALWARPWAASWPS